MIPTVDEVLVWADRCLDSEEIEELPLRFRAALDEIRAWQKSTGGFLENKIMSHLIYQALFLHSKPYRRQAAIIGVGVLKDLDETNARETLRQVLAAGDVGLVSAAVRGVRWGWVLGLDGALEAVSKDARMPDWLRAEAKDLIED